MPLGVDKKKEQQTDMEGTAVSLGLKECRRKRTTARRKLSRKFKVFRELYEKSNVEALKLLWREIEVCITELEKTNDAILEYLSHNDTDYDEELNTCTKYMETLERDRLEIYANLISIENKDKICSHEKFKLKAVEPPTFEGNIREWPTFKSNYERIVVPVYGEDPYVLLKCLRGSALEVVKGVEDNYERMIARLTEKYGYKAHILGAILQELKQVKPMQDCSGKKFVDFVNIVERCWLDLQKMGLESEMNNITNLRMIENSLPDHLRREWILKYQTLGLHDDIFPHMIEFLVRERKVINYSDLDLKFQTTSRVQSHNICGEECADMQRLNDDIQEIREHQEKYEKKFDELTNYVVNFLKENEVHAGTSRTNRNSYVPFQCWYHKTNGHSISECKTFLGMNVKDKRDLLSSRGVCFSCLRVGHLSRDCTAKIKCDKVDASAKFCGRFHHPQIHNVFDRENDVNLNAVNNNLRIRKEVLLMVNYIRSKGMEIPTLWDAGSNLSLITHRMAKKLGLKGEDINLSMTKVGNVTENLNTKVYKVPIMDSDGNWWEIEACGISEISSPVPKVDISQLTKVLKLRDLNLARPSGTLEFLIGADYASLIPVVIRTVGNLQLMKNQFGYCVRGSYDFAKEDKAKGLIVKVNHVKFNPNKDDIEITPFYRLEKQFDDFLNVEGLGVQCSPKCGGCACGKCSISGEFSLKEERELKMIEEGLTHDPIKKKFTATYPFLTDPSNLPNNYVSAYARLRSTERRLIKKGKEYTRKYEEQIIDMINRGVARKLSDDEVKMYKGPVYYIPHQEVNNPRSKSTPLRIVFNASATYKGYSLNGILAKGPDVLANMFGILLRFRQESFAIVGDIRKMYNSVEISEFDQNLHRFLWRSMEVERDPDQYILTRVTFGDKPSGIISILAMRQAAKMIKEYADTGKIIIENSYVDDILVSLPTSNDIARFIKEAEELLSQGNFHIKHWVMSGETKLETNSEVTMLDIEEEKVLGLHWNTKQDVYFFKIKLNFSRKVNGLHSGPDLRKEEFGDYFPASLTKRIVLSQTALIFDPLGLISPFILEAKLLLRELTMIDGPKSWDDSMSKHMYNQWKTLFSRMFYVEQLTFPRCIKPSNTVGDPILIVFCDASSVAFGCCAYIRWQLADGSGHSKLLVSKSKLAPKREITIPRLELCAAVLASRLRDTIIKEMKFKFERVLHITDSEIVRGQINNDKLKFQTFVAVRVAEIQTRTKTEEWYWTSSYNNPADYTTRITPPEELHRHSVWQNGPEYLKLPISQWPVSNKCSVEIPDKVAWTKTVHTMTLENDMIIDMKRFSSYNKLIRTVARVLNVAKCKSLKEMIRNPTSEEIRLAELYCVKKAQDLLTPQWADRYRRLGPFKDSNGIIRVGSRISSDVNWNRNLYALLPKNHTFTRLYVEHVHKMGHTGVEATLVKVQSKYWIPELRKLAKSVRTKCVICRKVDHNSETQCMGQLAPERLKPSPPFYNTSCDIFGPFWVKDTVKKRVKCKVYGIVFNCMSSRAVYIDLVEGYDTENLLVTLKRFISIHGFPKTMFSDGGTQLVAANKELKDMVSRWNKTKILEFGTVEGMSWNFNKSADAPWENGCSEALIRLIKRALYLSVGSNILTFGELQTVFFEVANLLNERPIGMKPGCDIDKSVYLCPNELLLGGINRNVPTGVWDESDRFLKRMEHIQQIVNQFWKRWMRDYFPTLIVRQKWHQDRRDMKKGDIVLVQDNNILSGVWKMAEVIQANPGKDGKVRDVCIRYKPNRMTKVYTGEPDIKVWRSVHKLVVLLPIEEIEESDFKF